VTDRTDWLTAKTKVISSTESPALFNMSPYQTQYELAVEKMAGLVPEYESTERMGWGQRLQDAIAQGVSSDHNVIIEGSEYELHYHQSVERMGSSIDYRISGVSGGADATPLGRMFATHGPGLLEIKNVDWLVYRDWPEEDLPDHIEIQVQHQLEVLRLNWAAVGVLVGGNRTELYTRLRDETVGAAIASKVEQFWRNIRNGVMPEPIMPQDADIIIKLHQFAEPNSVYDGQADVELADLCWQYQSNADLERLHAQEKKALKARILEHIKSAEVALANGYKISASMVAEAEVKAYTREAYRNFRIYKKESR
jgi:predicted phage-related endonuclease